MTVLCNPPEKCSQCLSGSTFDAITAAVAHVSFDGCVLRTNARFDELLGYTKEELAGMPLGRLCIGFDAAAERRYLAQLPTDRVVRQSITRAFRRKDGEVVHMPAAVSIVRAADTAGSCAVWVIDEPVLSAGTELGIEQIALNVSLESGEAFFRSLLMNAALALDVDMAFIGELTKDDPVPTIQTIVALDRGDIIPNFRYELAGTPCEVVMGREICCFPSGVARLFPRDQGLIDWGIESYIGAPLFASDHTPSGIMVILDRKPLADRSRADALFRIFAPRVAVELERHRAELELRRNEAFLTEAQRLGRIGSWEWDTVLGSLRLSPVARELYGRDFVAPEVLIDLIDPADRAQMRRAAAQLACDGTPLEMLFRMPRPDGEIRILQGRGAAVRNESGAVTRAIGTVQDVTERELANESVRMLSQAVEQIGEQVVITDLHARIEYVNAAFETQTGFSMGEVLGTSIFDLRVQNAAEEQAFRALLGCTREGIVAEGVFECRRKSGGTFWAELRVSPVRDVEGRVTRFITTAVDITERREIAVEQERLDAAVRRAAKEWRDTFDAIASPILVCDVDGIILRMNRAALEMSGAEGFSLIGGHITDLGPSALWKRAADIVRFARETGSQLASEVMDDASRKIFEVSVQLSSGTDPLMAIVIARDVTLTTELQASLRASEKMSAMGALVAGVAHEVRNPLFALSATLDALEARIGERQEFSRYTSILRGEIDRLNLLMHDLLDYGRPAVLNMREAALADVVRGAVTACEPLAGNAGVRILNGVSADFALLLIDCERVLQAISNVLQNAIQHAPAGSTVEIVPVERDGEVSFAGCAVLDLGPGFKTEDLPHVFEPFYTRRRGGTGLGLAIVQRIVERHGGQVSIASRPGGGSRVEIVFPRVKAEAGL